MLANVISGMFVTSQKQQRTKEIKMPRKATIRPAHLNSINSLRDLNPIYRDVVSGIKAIPDASVREPLMVTLRDTINTLQNKASGVQPPHEVAVEYRKAYVEIAAVQKLVDYHLNNKAYPIDPTISIPKGWVIDPRSQDSANTEVEQVIFHLNTLRDELAIRRKQDSLPPSIEGFIKEHVSVLPNRLTNYLVNNGKWDDLKAIKLWHYGFSINKPYGRSTHFTLSFDGYEIIIDFQKGFI